MKIVFKIIVFLIFLFNSQVSSQSAEGRNFLYTIAEIEHKMQYQGFTTLRFKAIKPKNPITKRVILRFDNGDLIQAKWKRAPRGGDISNNSPRYEIAAYKFQKLFLNKDEYVVPPTLARCMSLKDYQDYENTFYPTFTDVESVVFVLQYWLENVNSKWDYNEKRFERDPVYARHLANMNLFAHLIRHNDSNIGNFLISKIDSLPRIFVTDNGLILNSQESKQGFFWRKLQFDRFPKSTVERLRKITLDSLQNALGVVAQFKIEDAQLKLTEPTSKLKQDKGVIVRDKIIQFGLTEKEIKGIYQRIEEFLKKIDSGKLKTF